MKGEPMKKVILITFLLLFLCSCGYNEGIVQKTERSYLKFVGNWQSAYIQVDDLKPFTLDEYYNSAEGKQYEVSPGKHSITVTKNGAVVVNRILFLDNQTTMEIAIP
jgi:hypothetical protein